MKDFEQQLQHLPKGRLSRRADLAIRYKLLRLGFSQKFSGINFNVFAAARLRPVLAVAVILVLVFSGATSVYAYNSDQVTRASMLYPVKRGLENIESRLAATPAAQVKFHNKLAGRRIAEAQFLSQTAIASSTEMAASSSDEVSPVKLTHENEFNDTLSDADNEIEQANKKAGEVSDRTELDQSLALLSDSHLYELGKIKTMAGRVGLDGDDRTTDNLALILDNIKNHQQRIVRAISQFNGDLNRAGDDDSGEASSSQAFSAAGQANTTPGEATSSLDYVKGEIKDLQTELTQGGRVSTKQIKRLTDRLNKKINQAENAIQSGDLKKFNGLLKATEALTNNGQHFLRENKPEVRPTKATTTENSGEKIKAQFNQQELRRKQETERRKQEELRKRSEQQRQEQQKTDEQNQAGEEIKSDSQPVTSTTINAAPEQKIESSDGESRDNGDSSGSNNTDGSREENRD